MVCIYYHLFQIIEARYFETYSQTHLWKNFTIFQKARKIKFVNYKSNYLTQQKMLKLLGMINEMIKY